MARCIAKNIRNDHLKNSKKTNVYIDLEKYSLEQQCDNSVFYSAGYFENKTLTSSRTSASLLRISSERP